MSNTQHPHAEILRAIADGKEIQCEDTLKQGIWYDVNHNQVLEVILNNQRKVFRIKPETKTITVLIWKDGAIGIDTNPGGAIHSSAVELLEAIKEITYTPGEGL